MDSSSMSEWTGLIPFTAVKDFLVVLVEDIVGLYDFAKALSSVDEWGILKGAQSIRIAGP